MRYVVKAIEDLPTPLEGYTVTDISKAYQSIDGTEVLLQLTNTNREDPGLDFAERMQQTLDIAGTLNHSEMLALLQTAAWKVEDPANGL